MSDILDKAMKQVSDVRFTGLHMTKGDALTVTLEAKNGWGDLLQLLSELDCDLDVVRVYKLENDDMAGVYPGYAIIVGQVSKNNGHSHP